MLKDCITPLFADTEQLKELFKVEQSEMDQAEKAVEEWMNEFYIPRILDTIDRWEDDYALTHDTGLTLEQRRARIFAKKQQRKVPRKEVIEQVIKSLLGASRVTLMESDCFFEVIVETMTLIDNISIAEEYFHKIRVAHFDYKFINQVPRSYSMTKYFSPAVYEHKSFMMEVQR